MSLQYMLSRPIRLATNVICPARPNLGQTKIEYVGQVTLSWFQRLHMPWNSMVEYPLNAHFIHECAPTESGVYALCDADKWVYIGDAANLKQELLSHLNPGRNPQIDEATPTTFSFEVCPPEERVRRRERLIAELHPIVSLH